jgi:hypothetical protein
MRAFAGMTFSVIRDSSEAARSEVQEVAIEAIRRAGYASATPFRQ